MCSEETLLPPETDIRFRAKGKERLLEYILEEKTEGALRSPPEGDGNPKFSIFPDT